MPLPLFWGIAAAAAAGVGVIKKQAEKTKATEALLDEAEAICCKEALAHRTSKTETMLQKKMLKLLFDNAFSSAAKNAEPPISSNWKHIPKHIQIYAAKKYSTVSWNEYSFYTFEAMYYHNKKQGIHELLYYDYINGYDPVAKTVDYGGNHVKKDISNWPIFERGIVERISHIWKMEDEKDTSVLEFCFNACNEFKTELSFFKTRQIRDEFFKQCTNRHRILQKHINHIQIISMQDGRIELQYWYYFPKVENVVFNEDDTDIERWEKEEEQKRREEEYESKGYYVTDSKITISEWIDTWLEVYITPNVSPTTLSRYQGMIKRYIKPIIGHMQVQQLNTLAVQAWVNGLKISPSSGKPMAAATVKHAYHVLKGCMDKAVLAGIIPRSPCIGIMLPKGQKKAAIIYDEEQIKQLIAAAKGTEMELVIDMELCLGLRRGELLGLWWQDIDWEKKQIHVVRNRVVVNGKSVVKEPKTENSVRTIDMPDQLVQKLKLHQWACRANQQKLGKAYMESDYIIVHPDGKPIYPEYLSQMLTKLQKKANLPQCRFHDLRHLCATIMLLQGVNVKVAQERLGHKDIATTMNIYSHVLPSSAKEAAEKIGSLVFAS